MAVLSLLFSSLVTCSFLCSIFTLVQAEKYRKSSPRNWRFPTWLTRNWKNSPYFVARPYVSCGTTPYFEANDLFGDHSADKEPKWPWARDWKMMSQENGLSRVLSIFSSLSFFLKEKSYAFWKGKSVLNRLWTVHLSDLKIWADLLLRPRSSKPAVSMETAPKKRQRRNFIANREIECWY